MIEIENIETWGFEHAVRGMRNPLNSWGKSDSFFYENGTNTVLGEEDLYLMHKLYKAGNEHRKYLRQIFVSMDITAPLYWWLEMDTYKVGVTCNSCSKMHTIHKKEFELNDFCHEHLNEQGLLLLEEIITILNVNRNLFLKTKDKKYWWQLIQLLPSSYNQRRTVTMNYENVVNIIHQRSGHKLDEWNAFVKYLERLPYIKEIMGE